MYVFGVRQPWESRAVEDGGVKRRQIHCIAFFRTKIYRAAEQRREIHSEEASRATEEDLELSDADEPYECFRT